LEKFSTLRLYQFALYYVPYFRKLFGYIGSVDKEFDKEFHWATRFVWCCDGKQKIFIWYSCVLSIHSVTMKIKVRSLRFRAIKLLRVMISCRCKSIIKIMGTYSFIEIFIFVLLNKLIEACKTKNFLFKLTKSNKQFFSTDLSKFYHRVKYFH
jgi:hypothetical protein